MAVAESSVLVTGGRGFIARAVRSLLCREGFRILSLDQPVDSGAARVDPPAASLSCDIADATAVKSVFEKERIGAIIHLAAILPTAAQRDPVRATEVPRDRTRSEIHIFGIEQPDF